MLPFPRGDEQPLGQSVQPTGLNASSCPQAVTGQEWSQHYFLPQVQGEEWAAHLPEGAAPATVPKSIQLVTWHCVAVWLGQWQLNCANILCFSQGALQIMAKVALWCWQGLDCNICLTHTQGDRWALLGEDQRQSDYIFFSLLPLGFSVIFKQVSSLFPL